MENKNKMIYLIGRVVVFFIMCLVQLFLIFEQSLRWYEYFFYGLILLIIGLTGICVYLVCKVVREKNLFGVSAILEVLGAVTAICIFENQLQSFSGQIERYFIMRPYLLCLFMSIFWEVVLEKKGGSLLEIRTNIWIKASLYQFIRWISLGLGIIFIFLMIYFILIGKKYLLSAWAFLTSIYALGIWVLLRDVKK